MLTIPFCLYGTIYPQKAKIYIFNKSWIETKAKNGLCN